MAKRIVAIHLVLPIHALVIYSTPKEKWTQKIGQCLK
jgi:hypothetical protein